MKIAFRRQEPREKSLNVVNALEELEPSLEVKSGIIKTLEHDRISLKTKQLLPCVVTHQIENLGAKTGIPVSHVVHRRYCMKAKCVEKADS